MPTQQEEAMLNQIIKDWVGERKHQTSIAYLTNPPQYPKTNSLEYVDGYNQALQDLTSRIPQLTERIEKEVLTQIQLDLDNGKFYSICSNETTFTKYIINTLKGGKEN